MTDDVRLEPRQLECLINVAHGRTIKETAHRMGISDHTVKNQLAMAYRKLGVNDRVQAFLAVGWLHPPMMSDD